MSLTVEDKLAINDLMSRAAYAFDVQDLDMLEACFTEDAEFIMQIAGGDPVGPFVGRPAIMKLFADSIEVQTDVRKHVVSNLFFDESGEEPKATSNLTLISTENDETDVLTAGFYRDTLAHNDNEWRIAHRFIELDRAY